MSSSSGDGAKKSGDLPQDAGAIEAQSDAVKAVSAEAEPPVKSLELTPNEKKGVTWSGDMTGYRTGETKGNIPGESSYGDSKKSTPDGGEDTSDEEFEFEVDWVVYEAMKATADPLPVSAGEWQGAAASKGDGDQ